MTEKEKASLIEVEKEGCERMMKDFALGSFIDKRNVEKICVDMYLFGFSDGLYRAEDGIAGLFGNLNKGICDD